MVYRVYVEKKSEYASEAKALLSDAVTLLSVKGLENVRIINRYDVENITPELFDYAKKDGVFRTSDRPCDRRD